MKEAIVFVPWNRDMGKGNTLDMVQRDADHHQLEIVNIGPTSRGADITVYGTEDGIVGFAKDVEGNIVLWI